MQLIIHNLTKRLGHKTVLDKVDLHMNSGQIACLLGASGCGKTTLLRCVAGFEDLDNGSITLDGAVVSDEGKTVPPQHREVGMVFQDLALFPHLDVAGNAGFGLHSWPASEASERVADVLQLVGLSDMGSRYPHQLSGGQQQRAALARALAPRPKLLLLDEPFASLDRDLRYRLSREVARILQKTGTSALWVTHDQAEAMSVADAIGVMQSGQIIQWDTPANLFEHPGSRFVAEFFGECSVIDGITTADNTVSTVLGEIPFSGTTSCEPGVEVEVMVRPDQLALHDEGLLMRITETRYHGAESLLIATMDDGTNLGLLRPFTETHTIGDTIRVCWHGNSATVFEKHLN